MGFDGLVLVSELNCLLFPRYQDSFERHFHLDVLTHLSYWRWHWNRRFRNGVIRSRRSDLSSDSASGPGHRNSPLCGLLWGHWKRETKEDKWSHDGKNSFTTVFLSKSVFFSTSPKHPRMKKLKTQRKNSKPKHKTQGFGKSGKNCCRKQGYYF